MAQGEGHREPQRPPRNHAGRVVRDGRTIEGYERISPETDGVCGMSTQKRICGYCQRIRETCSCGASVEVRLNSQGLAREVVDQWRASHRHEVRDTAPVAAQDGQQAVIDPDGWVCSDCGGSPGETGETVLFDLARMAPGRAYPVTINGQRVVAVKNHQDNINFYPLHPVGGGCEHRNHDWDAGGWVCSDCGAPADCADCGPPPGVRPRKREAGGG